jgi:molybdopterin-guanine dinucleotide biosynthesis protein A
MKSVIGVLLAGGQSRRMGGGDKNLNELAGRPILAHVIDRAQVQVDRLIINANGDPARFEPFGLPVIGDVVDGFQGPLAGVLTGLEWAAANAPAADWVATFATDAPFFPDNLVARLFAGIEERGADMACAVSGGRTHPVFALWPVRLARDLRHSLTVEEIRKIDRWTARYAVAEVAFPVEPFDPFFNINRPGDLEAARRFATGT